MARVTASSEIHAANEVVWALMCDPGRYDEWADPTERMLDVPKEDVGVGFVYREYGGIPPFKGESEWRVTEFEPIRRQVHVGDDGTMKIDISIDLLPTQVGTRFTLTVALRPRWFLVPVNAFLWPLFMRKRSQESVDRTVTNVKRIVESPASA